MQLFEITESVKHDPKRSGEADVTATLLVQAEDINRAKVLAEQYVRSAFTLEPQSNIVVSGREAEGERCVVVARSPKARENPWKGITIGFIGGLIVLPSLLVKEWHFTSIAMWAIGYYAFCSLLLAVQGYFWTKD